MVVGRWRMREADLAAGGRRRRRTACPLGRGSVPSIACAAADGSGNQKAIHTQKRTLPTVGSVGQSSIREWGCSRRRPAWPGRQNLARRGEPLRGRRGPRRQLSTATRERQERPGMWVQGQICLFIPQFKAHGWKREWNDTEGIKNQNFYSTERNP